VRKACIFGCSGATLTAEERAFFAHVRPWGFILFHRNIEGPEQVRALVAALRDSVDDPRAPVLIDQEGGRVQRLRAPHWPSYPPASAYGRIAGGDPLESAALARLGGRLIAADLHALGVNVDCAPVLDLPVPGADPIIGDRAFSGTAARAAPLARAFSEGLLAGGVLPVIKHIPGHGRATADSHVALPVVLEDRATLEADFEPFRMLSDMPMAMTAHVVYAAIDPKRPATTSKPVIALIRDDLGFEGLIMSDDLSMQALRGGLAGRARRALAAGCDVVLHCNGALEEMKAVASGARVLSGSARRRADAALGRLVATVEPLDEAWARARFAAAIGL